MTKNIIISLVIVLALCAGGYYFFRDNTEKNKDVILGTNDTYATNTAPVMEDGTLPEANPIINVKEDKKTHDLLQKLLSKPTANIAIYDNGHAKYEIENSNW
jgi:hypothetical protein